jgi:hypothetical protein
LVLGVAVTARQSAKGHCSEVIQASLEKEKQLAEDLPNLNWTRGLWRMSSAEEMAEFVILWDQVQNVQLSNSPDEFRWRWTADGNYSAKSAYSIQFQGSFCTFNSMALWTTNAEGKHRLFAWLLVQNRILTADRLLARNWPCNPICILCDQDLETADHLCLHCVYAREVWQRVSVWSDGLFTVPVPNVSVETWWNSSVQGRPPHQWRKAAAFLIYTAWGLWKERNRSIFRG